MLILGVVYIFECLKMDFKISKSILVRIFLTIYRFGNWVYYNVRVPIVRQILLVIYRVVDFAIIRIVGGGELPAQCSIGGGLRLPHGLKGIVIHGNCVIGENVTIFHQVTLGVNDYDTVNYGAPSIRDRVYIGAGAKIIGHIFIGSDAKIGANAVVITDVPANSTAVGVPSRIVK